MASYWQQIVQGRLSRRRMLAATGGGALGAAFLAACGGGDSGSKGTGDASGLLTQPFDDYDKVQHGGTVVSAGRPLTSLDPIGSSAIGINFRMYDTLWKRKIVKVPGVNDGSLTGSAFESWEISPDKLQITGKISQKAHFVPDAPLNGRVVSASDIAYTFDRYKKVGALRGEVVNEVTADAPVVSMTALDDKTLQIKLARPDATVLGLLAQVRAGCFYVLPKEAEAIDIKNKSIGSGPWQMKEWLPGQGAKLKRNPGYNNDYRGADLPYLDEWHYPEMSETAVAIAQFRAGGIQNWTTYIPQEEILGMKRENNALMMRSLDPASTSLRIIMGHLPTSPFKDDRVRRAIMMTIDHDLALDTLGATQQFTNAGLTVEKGRDGPMWIDTLGDWSLDPTSKEFGPNSKNYLFNMDEAKKLLAAAGFPNGLETELNVTYGYNAGILKKMEVVMALLGGGSDGIIKFNINQLDYQTEWSPKIRLIRGQINGVALLNDVDTPDPTLYMYSRFHSAGGVYQGGDSTLDDLLSKARAEFDDQKRKELIWEAQRYEGGVMHYPLTHGGASTFELNWPALRGVGVWDGDTSSDNEEAQWWIDPTKAPFNKA